MLARICLLTLKKALSLSLSPSHLLAARLGNAESYRDRLAEGGRAVRRNGR